MILLKAGESEMRIIKTTLDFGALFDVVATVPGGGVSRERAAERYCGSVQRFLETPA